MSDIFISYSRNNKPWVKKLAAALEADGYDVWWDPQILPGQDYETVISEALETVKCVITVWSNDSVKSTWVKAESNKGLERNILVPILYQDVTPPMPFGRIHSADFRNWNEKAQNDCYQDLLKAIDQHSAPTKPITTLREKPSPKRNNALVFSLIAVTAIAVTYSVLNIKQTAVIQNTEKQSVKTNLQNTKPLASEKTSYKKVDKDKQVTAINYIDNGDGTVTDRATKLPIELQILCGKNVVKV